MNVDAIGYLKEKVTAELQELLWKAKSFIQFIDI